MSRIGWRWMNQGRDGSLFSFSDTTPWPPNEPYRSGCLTVGIPPNEAITLEDRIARVRGERRIIPAGRSLGAHGLDAPADVEHGPAPCLYCSCGVYTFNWSEDALALPMVSGYRQKCKVLVVVEVWGSVVEHELGFRAEWNAIRAALPVYGRALHPAWEVHRPKTIKEMVDTWEEPEDDGTGAPS